MQVEYQVEFAEWLLVAGCEASNAGTAADALLQVAVSTLKEVEAAAAAAAAEGKLVVARMSLCFSLNLTFGASENTKAVRHDL